MQKFRFNQIIYIRKFKTIKLQSKNARITQFRKWYKKNYKKLLTFYDEIIALNILWQNYQFRFVGACG